MSNEEAQPAPKSAAGAAPPDPLREVRHDLRHALYVLDLGLTLLTESRTDEERFAEVVQMLRKEQATITKLSEELLKVAANRTGGATDGGSP